MGFISQEARVEHANHNHRDAGNGRMFVFTHSSADTNDTGAEMLHLFLLLRLFVTHTGAEKSVFTTEKGGKQSLPVRSKTYTAPQSSRVASAALPDNGYMSISVSPAHWQPGPHSRCETNNRRP